MDLTIQMRSADLLLKFLKHDVEHIPPYGYSLQKQRFTPKPPSVCLPRSTPEAQGISSWAVERFFADVGREADTIAAHGMLVMRHGFVIGEGCWAPYRADVPHMLYSMSKSITGTAVGMAVDEGFLSVDERLIDIFPEYVGSSSAKILKAHTVWNLLTMTSGCRYNEVGSMLDENWVRMFMESVPKFEAGSTFEYNSLNSYMLAAIVAKRTGMTLTEFLTPRLYEPLGIRYHDWEKCPQGIEKGGWGLSLTMEDAAKIGQLYLNGGMWNGRRLLSESWVEAATRVQAPTPNGELKHGYGYQIWVADEEGSFQFNGAFGQYVVVMPKYDAIVVVFSGSSNLFAQSSLNRHIQRLFAGGTPEPLPEDPRAWEALRQTLDGLVFSPTLPVELGTDADAFDRISYRLNGREYVTGPNTGGLFPQTLQAVHGNYTESVTLIRFQKTETGIRVYLYEHDECNALDLRADGGMAMGAATMRGERHLTGTRCLWRLGPEGIRLTIVTCFIETPNTRILHLNIRQNKLTAIFEELPALDKTVEMLFQLVGISQTAYYKKLVPMLRKENLVKLVHSMTVPTAEGTLVKHNEEEPLPLLPPLTQGAKALPARQGGPDFGI